MAERIVQEESLVAVADAIRAKGGTSDPLSFPGGFADAIAAIQAGGGGVSYGVIWSDFKTSYPSKATLLTRKTYVPSYLCYKDGSLSAYFEMETFEMPNTITQICAYAFYGCDKLKNINTSNITKIGDYAFYKCNGLSELGNPDLSKVVEIGAYAFATNTGTATLSGQLSLPLATKIGKYAFNRISLTDVDLPLVTSLGTYAFSNCTSLTTVNVPLITSLETRTFEVCKSLKTLDVPLVKSIAAYVFNNCTSFATLILRSETMTTLSNINAFNGTLIASGSGYIYVPRALVDSYKAASNWSTFANQFRALEDYTVDGTITGELDESKI